MATPSQLRRETEAYHVYHATADVLRGDLRQPVEQHILPQAPVSVKDRRGGHYFQRAGKYSLEGLISFETGFTHVSGSASAKGHGWVTLATSVLEGLNVLDVVTADRMVAQVSTEHPLEKGHVPHVTFLGTRFENLRVAGHPVHLDFDFGICGDKPQEDHLYTADPGFLDRVTDQCENIRGTPGLPTALREQYTEELKKLTQLSNGGNRPSATENTGGNGSGTDGHKVDPRWGESQQKPKPPRVTCSLVKGVSPIPGARSFGNVLEIPGFGIVYLAQLEVSDYFELTMLDMRMGCIGDGTVKAGTTRANGQTIP